MSYTQNAFTQLFTPINLDGVKIEALAGDDIIRISRGRCAGRHAEPQRSASPSSADRSTTGDRLAVVDDRLGDLVLHRLGPDDSSGTVTVGPLGARWSTARLRTSMSCRSTTSRPARARTALGRLVIFKHDPLEENDTLPNATFVGVGVAINVDPTIDPPADAPFCFARR